jgi:hypothetical protein
MRAVSAVCFASALLLVVATSGLAAPSSPASTRGGPVQVVKDPAGGISISLPKSWVRYPPHGSLGNLRQRINYIAPGSVFWGITISSTPRNPKLATASSLAGTKPLQALARKYLKSTKISHLQVAANHDLPAGFAALVSYDITAPGSASYAVRSYWLVSGGRLVVLAGVTKSGQMAVRWPAFETIFRSFRPIG